MKPQSRAPLVWQVQHTNKSKKQQPFEGQSANLQEIFREPFARIKALVPVENSPKTLRIL